MDTAQPANSALNEATALLLQGKARKAERLLRKVLRATPDNAEALHLAGVARHRACDNVKARALIEQAIRSDPDVSEYHFTYAGLLTELQDREAAIAAYERALELDPADVDGRFSLAQLYVQVDRTEDAVRAYRRVLDVTPDNARVIYNLGNALLRAGDVEAAISEYRKIVDAQPDYIPVYVNLGNALVRQRRVQEAFSLYREGAQRKFAPIELDEDTLKRPVQASKAKLQHDAEQIDYLIARGVLSDSYATHAQTYRETIASAPEARALTQSFPLPRRQRRAVAQAYNRMIHLDEAARCDGSAINPMLDSTRIEREYRDGEPELVYVDDFLTPAALEGIRRFCLESTIWFTHYDGGYLGAFLGDGFASPLLAQIVEELPKSLPGIFGNHRLRQAWAFKYDSRLRGINLHADFAAVNVNFWITPDEALEEEDSGGLIVWDKEAPADWDFDKFNNDQAAMRQFLEESDARAVRVPYRQNRALIFNSDLFHETDHIAFKPGYENRRINITLLYGDRQSA